VKIIKYYSCYNDLSKSDKTIPPFPKFILDELTQKYEFVWDEENADYFIWHECVYSHYYCFKKFQKLYNVNKINIFNSGEAFTPDLNLFDYIFSYDANIQAGDRFHRLLPIPHLFNRQDEFIESPLSKELAIKELHSKKHFCNFIYSNGSAPKYRDELLLKLTEYKFVNSLGKHLNNTVNTRKRTIKSWYEDSIEIKKDYRFSIACENAYYLGYTSEKILSSFEAGTIPIYWGNPLITEEFNPKAFINCHDYDHLDDLIEKIREIEDNKSLWIQMIMEPKRTESQEKNLKIRVDNYINAWDIIFSQPLSSCKRTNHGTQINMYYKSFLISRGLYLILHKYFYYPVLLILRILKRFKIRVGT
jgi:alpha(1,3/1,4) fucosyltransferase